MQKSGPELFKEFDRFFFEQLNSLGYSRKQWLSMPSYFKELEGEHLYGVVNFSTSRLDTFEKGIKLSMHIGVLNDDAHRLMWDMFGKKYPGPVFTSHCIYDLVENVKGKDYMKSLK